MHHICSSNYNEEKVWALNNNFYYIWYIDDYRVNLPDMYTLCNKAINNIFFFTIYLPSKQFDHITNHEKRGIIIVKALCLLILSVYIFVENCKRIITI